MPSRVVALVAVLIVALSVAGYRLRHDRALWNADGAIYLRMALQDRGISPDAATRTTNAYMLAETSEANDPETRDFYGPAPPRHYVEQAGLFVTRPLYPALASLFIPHFGPFGLKVLSALAYVAAVVLMYLLLLDFAPPAIAALGALGLALSPNVLNHAAYPLTEMLALAFWIATIFALFRYLRAPSRAGLVVLVLAAALLAFTRPAIYLPFGAALAVWIGAPRGTTLRRAAGTATLAMAAIGIAFGIYTALVHGPGITAQLRWQYEWQQFVHGRFADDGFASWWLRSIGAALATELLFDAYKNNNLFALVLAAFGVLVAPRSVIVYATLGVAIALLVAVLVNPLELVRTVLIPFTPLVIVLATIALAALWRTVRTAPA